MRFSIAEFRSGFFVVIGFTFAGAYAVTKEGVCVLACKFKAADDISKASRKGEEEGHPTPQNEVNLDVVQKAWRYIRKR
tara:strand:+ start:1110 stop:1346 length:237 start_codon:yes stop_codon:yes gene_type:complete